MRRPFALLVALLLAVATDLLVGGCVSLPRAGPVRTEAVSNQGDSDALVDYTPPGPRRGVAPVPLVDNFLLSMTATPLNTYVAREYLTTTSSRSWAPEHGTLVYGNQQIVARRGGVVVRLSNVVALDSRGEWRGDPTHGHGLSISLRLVKEDGQWRIDKPPNRLLIPRAQFDSQYEQYLLYFFDRTAQVLVPEPVYVPRGRQAPTLLVAGLLQGPEPYLRRTERTFLPAGTSLDGISVPVSRKGTAEVPLNHQVLDVDNKQLGKVFAQVAWTLGQVPGVQRLRITVDGTPVDLPNAGEDVAVDSWSGFDPSVGWASTALFGVRDGHVVSIDGHGEDRISGVLGTLDVGLRSIAVDLLGQHVAGVSTDGRRVWQTDRDGVPGRTATRADLQTVYSGTNVLQPAYDLYGQLWLVDRTADGARLSVVHAGVAKTVTAAGLSGTDLTRFALSRDGTRVLAEVRQNDQDRLLLARVQRDEEGRVLGLSAPRRLVVPGLSSHIRDVAWRTPASAVVLVDGQQGTSRVVSVKIDGPADSSAASTAETLRARGTRLVAAPGAPLYVSTESGRLYSLTRRGWVASSVDRGLRAATFVG